MKEVSLLLLAAGTSFLVFVSAAARGVLKKNGRLLALAAFAFVAGGGFAGRGGYIFLRGAKVQLVNALKPRTGSEVYAALFGSKQATCVKVLHCQDQVVPKIDYAIWLQFETCPQELKRLLALHNFTGQKQAGAGWNTTALAAPESWFKPESLGDSVLVFTYRKDNYGAGQTLYTSADSTRAFCVDFSE